MLIFLALHLVNASVEFIRRFHHALKWILLCIKFAIFNTQFEHEKIITGNLIHPYIIN